MKTAIIIVFGLFIGTTTLAQTSDSTRLAEIRELTLSRVSDLQEYMTVIADKKRTMDERLMNIDLANVLFAMPLDKQGRPRKALVQVSRKGGATRILAVEQYLKNLLNARYAQVQLTTYDVITEFGSPNQSPGRTDLKIFFGDVKVTETLPVPIK